MNANSLNYWLETLGAKKKEKAALEDKLTDVNGLIKQIKVLLREA